MSEPPLPPDPDAAVDAFNALLDHTDPSSPAFKVQGGALLAWLKALHRSANVATRAIKQQTAEARLAMDQTHLGLQNLLYERRHLEREIDKCRQFASIYQDVPLHSLEEFKEIAPDEAKTEEVFINEHSLMLNRLSFELAERHRLEERRKALQAVKEAKLKVYKDNEKLVNEWLTGGTGLERAVMDQLKMGRDVASKVNRSTLLPTEPSAEKRQASAPADKMSTPTPTAPATPMHPSIPTGPRAGV
ncbi:hypothetical protein SISSUDRAFT_1045276 [Sistotremastrum suecicum HHB10207 ss-3]|uniref:Uncharacterized protein n=1 Tax=Sistotremastrum suecicum HHB10207 ss-3 TaxID=1314776 RepID=A0A166EHR2_9AGAM|nr:hypothetical protein SISSUDRAFT_1045276 [Sistotremastrum suecicum HHB10207 ss-3]